jgi:hypothetical protein
MSKKRLRRGLTPAPKGVQGDKYLKWRPKLKLYTNSTRTLEFNPFTEEAYSNGALFLCRFNGKLIINPGCIPKSAGWGGRSNYYHASAVEYILKALKLQKPKTLYNERELTELEYEYLPDVYRELYKHQAKLHRKRIRKHTKAWLRECIREFKKTIKMYNKLGISIHTTQQKHLEQDAIDTERARAANISSDYDPESAKIARDFAEDLLANSFRNQKEENNQ